jgi:2-hydroxy-6-oxonona-2,4-dienedioate hydrolase
VPGIETRVRAAEARIAAAYGLSLSERMVELKRPPARVRVLEGGQGDPLIFVNGISAPGIGFAPLAGRLPGRRYVLLDLPGHGLAPPYRWTGGPLRDQAVGVLTGVLDALGIERATFVGNSLGGMFTLWLVVSAPERVSDAVIIGEPAVALPGAQGSKSMEFLTGRFGWLAQQSMRAPAPRSVVRKGMVRAIGERAAQQMSDDMVDVHSLSIRLPGKAASFRSLLRRVLDGRTPRPECALTDDELTRITTPLLFVWGDKDDEFLSPVDGQMSVAKIPTATFETVAAGHTPWLDDAARCGQLVSQFLSRTPPPGATPSPMPR